MKKPEDKCSVCGQPVYVNGEGTWFGPDGELMCANCGPSKVTLPERVWDPEKGCWKERGDA